MEPSLRSSSYRAVESKLRRTDSSLHETIQRFVESLSTDVRVSQYADINYAAKKFMSDKWYWLKPTGISGYLVFLPNTPVVWIDEQFKKSYRIPMRVSKDIYEKNTVMIASLNVSEGILRLEDMWIQAGWNLRNKPFTQRWSAALDFYTLYYKPDLVLQQGIHVETAIYQSLYSIHHMDCPPLMIAQGEVYQRRLRVQLGSTEQVKPLFVNETRPEARPEHRPEPRPEARPEHRPEARSEARAEPRSEPKGTIAIPHPEYPDTYDIWINGVKKGYAAVQDIELSRRLKKACETKASAGLCVRVEWNNEFSSYEIVGF
jgi:hypothetical protein